MDADVEREMMWRRDATATVCRETRQPRWEER
jgi:hypothetical protein